jgi:hypothetical protein
MRRDKPQTPLAEIIASNIADGTATYMSMSAERGHVPRAALVLSTRLENLLTLLLKPTLQCPLS